MPQYPTLATRQHHMGAGGGASSLRQNRTAPSAGAGGKVGLGSEGSEHVAEDAGDRDARREEETRGVGRRFWSVLHS